MSKEISLEIKKPEILILLLLLGIFVFMELKVTFSNPIAFGDEGFHTFMAKYMAEQKEYPKYLPLISTKIDKVSFDRPPLWNSLEGGFYLLFGFHESIVKFLTPFLVFLTGLGTYILTKKLFNKNVAFIATIITVTIPSYVTYSVLFYVEMLTQLFLTFSILTTLIFFKTKEKKYGILSGIFSGLSILSKTTGVIVIPFIGLCFLYDFIKSRKFSDTFKEYLPIGVLMLLIVFTMFLRSFAFYGTPSCYFLPREGCHLLLEKYEEKYSFERSTANIGTGSNFINMGLTNYTQFVFGYNYFVLLFFFCGLLLLFYKQDKVNTMIFLGLILFLSLFYYTSNGRAEDTARYTLGIITFVSIVCALYFDKIIDFVKTYYKHAGLIVFIAVILLSFLNLREKLNVMNTVKKFSPLFFDACDFIKKNTTEDSLFFAVYASPTLYNCERGALLRDEADIMLSNDLNLTLNRLNAHGFTHIFVQKFALSSGEYREGFPITFVQFLSENPEHFVKLYENGLSIDQCIQAGGCDGTIVYEVKN